MNKFILPSGLLLPVLVICQKEKPNSKPAFCRGAGYCCLVDYPDIQLGAYFPHGSWLRSLLKPLFSLHPQ
jgi:hypothetical protein